MRLLTRIAALLARGLLGLPPAGSLAAGQGATVTPLPLREQETARRSDGRIAIHRLPFPIQACGSSVLDGSTVANLAAGVVAQDALARGNTTRGHATKRVAPNSTLAVNHESRTRVRARASVSTLFQRKLCRK